MTRMHLDTGDTAALRYARSGDLEAEVDSLARPLVEQGDTPGIVVGVLLPDGETRFYGYGRTARDGDQAPDGDTLFPLGSLSKGFLGGIAAMLVEDGVLSWDDTLAELLPGDTPLSPDAGAITLLQLATHSSGLPRQPMTVRTLRYFLGYLFTGRSFYRHFDQEYILDYLADFSAPAQPAVQYSNIGYGVLGHVIELHSGTSLESLLASRIAQPLGLANTGYAPEDLPAFETRARGHAGDQPKFIRRGRPVRDWDFTGIMKGSAAMHSNAKDMLAFAAAHLGADGQPPSPVLADTLRPRIQRERGAAAVAWLVDDIDQVKIAYQVGVVAGYTSYIGIDVERRTAVVVLQNHFTWRNDIGHNLLLRMARASSVADTGPETGIH